MLEQKILDVRGASFQRKRLNKFRQVIAEYSALENDVL